MTINFKALADYFPVEKVSWRIGPTTKEKDKGIGLAFIDARDVMDRLDEVCGPENWQDKYTHISPEKTICEIGIHIFVMENDRIIRDEWVWKADGSGDTDVESAKGSLSDSFKRAAVRWGIGRYLYSIPNTWVSINGSGSYFKIPDHELERLMATLPNWKGGLIVSPMTGQPKTPAKFWDEKVYSVLPKLPKILQDAHGDADWNNPETVAWLCAKLPEFIDKAPSRLHLVKLQADNLVWLGKRLPKEDLDAITDSFVIRATQFDQQVK